MGRALCVQSIASEDNKLNCVCLTLSLLPRLLPRLYKSNWGLGASNASCRLSNTSRLSVSKTSDTEFARRGPWWGHRDEPWELCRQIMLVSKLSFQQNSGLFFEAFKKNMFSKNKFYMWSWRNGTMVKSTYCSYRNSGFSSKHIHDSSSLGDPHPLLIWGHQAHPWHAHASKIFIYKINLKKGGIPYQIAKRLN